MIIKEYQEQILQHLNHYLTVLKHAYTEEQRRLKILSQAGEAKLTNQPNQYCKMAWDQLAKDGKLPLSYNRQGQGETPPWIDQHDPSGRAIPHVCLKVPTGGGKTLLGVSGIECINFNYFGTNTGMILWIVPTSAIYTQTLKKFQDKNHPYRQILERAAAGRLKILQKHDGFSQHDIAGYLCVMVLMLQSANRHTKASLKVFQDSGRFMELLPDPLDYATNAQLKQALPHLDTYEDELALGESRGLSLKHSLGNALRLVRPLVVLDEGHRAYSELARSTISSLSPRFILELSATPNTKGHFSNILVQVSGLKLKAEEMIKLPIQVRASAGADWRRTLDEACDQLNQLDQHAKAEQAQSRQYIRPIMLIQVERTGQDQRSMNSIHTEDVREYLEGCLGVPPAAIKAKTSAHDELKDEELLSETSAVRFIITQRALQEGWDCPFVYILTILSNSQATLALSQLIGRILRQPYAQRSSQPTLNSSYVFCRHKTVADVVKHIKHGLQKEGMEDELVNQLIHTKLDDKDDNQPKKITAKRNPAFQDTEIYLPQILHQSSSGWRKFIYQEDILQHLDFEDILFRNKDIIDLNHHQEPKVYNFEYNLGGDPAEISAGVSPHQPHPLSSVDFVVMSARLSEIIPNPFIAASILADTIDHLLAKGVSREVIYFHRAYLLQEMAKDLREQIAQQSAALFKAKLAQGLISFRIIQDHPQLNHQLKYQRQVAMASPNQVLRHHNGSPLQKSLFDTVYQNDMNHYEQQVAWYLDEHEAVQWWHRLAARDEYHLQGWQANKIYPDFLVCVDTHNLHKSKFIIETKGDHLKGNDDTQYKQQLFETLENHLNDSIVVGELENSAPHQSTINFRILMAKNWMEQINKDLS